MTTEVELKGKAGTLRKMLTDFKVEIAHALPKHVSAERMLRIALTSARKNPELLECTPESFLGAVIQTAQLGLEPDTPLGHGYLLPFWNSKTAKKEVNFMPGYRGLMELVYRAPGHPILMPAAVYEGDHFEYEKGLSPKLIHKPMPHEPSAKLTHVYCVASFPDGRKEFMVMTRAEIEAIRVRSKARKGPWDTDHEAMSFKTVIRRMVKYLPMSAEVQQAVGLDDLAEIDQSQNNGAWIKANQPIQTKAERVAGKMSDDPDSFDNFNE